jgi:hypothetical protein
VALLSVNQDMEAFRRVFLLKVRRLAYCYVVMFLVCDLYPNSILVPRGRWTGSLSLFRRVSLFDSLYHESPHVQIVLSLSLSGLGAFRILTIDDIFSSSYRRLYRCSFFHSVTSPILLNGRIFTWSFGLAKLFLCWSSSPCLQSLNESKNIRRMFAVKTRTLANPLKCRVCKHLF